MADTTSNIDSVTAVATEPPVETPAPVEEAVVNGKGRKKRTPFCCEWIPNPGWSHGMMDQLVEALCCGSDIVNDSSGSFCGIGIHDHKFDAIDPEGKRGTLEYQSCSGCGLCGFTLTEGMADSFSCNGLCSLIVCSKGSNEYASYCGACLLGNGCTTACGDHGGFGCSLGFMGCFLGKAVRAFQCCLWECGSQSFDEYDQPSRHSSF